MVGGRNQSATMTPSPIAKAFMNPTVTISPRGEQRLRGGHPWIYRADIGEVNAGAGDLVGVRNVKGRLLGSALYSDRSQIAIRMLTSGEKPADEALIASRIDAAIAFRESLGIDGTAYRLVHGEADLLPSLVVDRYGDYLVVQALSQGMDRLVPVVVRALTERLNPRGILARNDPRARTLDGLPQTIEVLSGDVPDTVTARESGIEYEVDLRHGQKTGLFLDQRENREAAARVRAWSGTRLFQLQRWLRPEACVGRAGDDCLRHFRGCGGESARERGAQRPERGRPRGKCLR